jgi:hypothetical protein
MGQFFASESGSGAGVLVQSNTGVRAFFRFLFFIFVPAVPFSTLFGHSCHSFLGGLAWSVLDGEE